MTGVIRIPIWIRCRISSNWLKRTGMSACTLNGRKMSEQALRKAFGEYKDRTVFLDIRTTREANVFPMVAAGKGLSEIILAEDL